MNQLVGLRLRLARLALALGGVIAACWSCNAPFIPIPPPGQTATFTSALVADGDGGMKTVWIAHGPPNKSASYAHVYVFNDTRMAGVIAEAAEDGSFDSPPFDGALGDRVDINYQPRTGGEPSPAVCFSLTTDAAVTPPNTLPSAPVCP